MVIRYALAALIFAGCAPKFSTFECYSNRDCPSDQRCELDLHTCFVYDSGEPPDSGSTDADSGGFPDAEPDGGTRDALPDAGVFEGVWNELQPNDAPSPREGAAIAYSPFDRAIVLAGGCANDANDCTEMWTWSGFNWEQRTAVAPLPARRDAILAESDGGPPLIFGGRDPRTGASLSDSLLWTGGTWFTVDVLDPPVARFSAAAAYDPLHRVIVMFGGFTCPLGQQGCEALADTCFFERSDWRCDILDGPPERGEHVMVFDSARGHVVMFGGRNTSGLLDDTWIFDGARWMRGDSGPPARAGAGMVFDAIRGVSVLFGGQTSGAAIADETWELHGFRWLQAETGTTAPPARHRAALGYDSGGNQIIVFGGLGMSGVLGDSWEYRAQR